jgi:hypothetical protein
LKKSKEEQQRDAFNRLVNSAKYKIISELRFFQVYRKQDSCTCKLIQANVLDHLSLKLDGEPRNAYPNPKNRLAFIIAYKELEAEKKIIIQRPIDIPYPMTNNETIFKLGAKTMKEVS